MSWPSEWQRQLFLLMCFMSSCDRFRKECFHFICSPMSLHHMTLVSFRLLRKNLDNLWKFLDKWFTNAPLPPSKKLSCGCKKFKYQPREVLCTSTFFHANYIAYVSSGYHFRLFNQDAFVVWISHPFIWIAESELLVMLSNNWIEVSCNTNKIIIRWQAI